VTISFLLTTYGRRCWVCPQHDPNGFVGFYILISYCEFSNYNTGTNIDSLISAFLVRFYEWINEVKRSPTLTPENDEEYEDREINYEAERQARQTHKGEDLI
jgi:hypothetical protein